MMRGFGSLAILAFWVAHGPEASKRAGDICLVYTGSYSDAKDPGIQVFRLDLTSGALARVGGAPGVAHPSFLAVHPSKKFLYAVSEIGDFGGKKTGAVASFALDEKGIPSLLNQQPSGGEDPCFISLDSEGKNALVANYGGGSVAVLPIGADGRLGPPSCVVQHRGSSVDKRRQSGPHAHSINLAPGGKFAFAADLGLDKILIYRFDGGRGILTAHDPAFVGVAAGSGPRHFAFHPGGKFAYACGEMTSTVIAFVYDAEKGLLKEQQTLSTLPREVKGNSTAEVQVSPDGKFVYVSNRGHDSVAFFSVDPASGTLTPEGHVSCGGKTPRHFGIDPSGKFMVVANQDSNSLSVFRIDSGSGKPEPTGRPTEVAKPVCVKLLMKKGD